MGDLLFFTWILYKYIFCRRRRRRHTIQPNHAFDHLAAILTYICLYTMYTICFRLWLISSLAPKKERIILPFLWFYNPFHFIAMYLCTIYENINDVYYTL